MRERITSEQYDTQNYINKHMMHLQTQILMLSVSFPGDREGRRAKRRPWKLLHCVDQPVDSSKEKMEKSASVRMLVERTCDDIKK